MKIRTCAGCGVEYLGAPESHDCERDAWARPLRQPVNATGAVQPPIAADLERDCIGG